MKGMIRRTALGALASLAWALGVVALLPGPAAGGGVTIAPLKIVQTGLGGILQISWDVLPAEGRASAKGEPHSPPFAFRGGLLGLMAGESGGLSPLSGGGSLSVALYGQISPFFHGDAGSGKCGVPSYGEAFQLGYGGGGELAWRPGDLISVLAGMGYEYYSGDDHEGISFDSLYLVPVYVGGKLHFASKESPWDPYFRADLGGAYMSEVEVSHGGADGTYWSSSWNLLADFGLGLEYRFGSLGVAAEVKARYLDDPDPAMGHPSYADSPWTLPVRLGVVAHF